MTDPNQALTLEKTEELDSKAFGEEDLNQENEKKISLLNEVLAEQDEVFRYKVLDLVTQHQLAVDDPLFLIMASTGHSCFTILRCDRQPKSEKIIG